MWSSVGSRPSPASRTVGRLTTASRHRARGYDRRVEQRSRSPSGRLARALRTLERKLGADREGRTLWVWVVPAATPVVTFVILAFIGVQGKVDLALTLPMAFVLSLFLGVLSAFYLTAASSDERDKDDGPDGPSRPKIPPDEPPPPGTEATPAVVRVPTPPSRGAKQRLPDEVGSGSRR